MTQFTAVAAERAALIKGSIVNIRSEANVNSKKVANLFSNTNVTVGDSVKNSNGESWYPVTFSSGKGYVRSDFIKFPVQYQRNEQFENDLNQQGFPESYKEGLRSLHAEFPNWRFQGFKTNLNWNDVLDGEMEGTGSLVDKNAISSWKSTDAGKYDWNTGTWPGFDGPTWVGASRALTAYYMDPRNFFDESYIFQFLLHNYNPEEQTKEALWKAGPARHQHRVRRRNPRQARMPWLPIPYHPMKMSLYPQEDRESFFREMRVLVPKLPRQVPETFRGLTTVL